MLLIEWKHKANPALTTPCGWSGRGRGGTPFPYCAYANEYRLDVRGSGVTHRGRLLREREVVSREKKERKKERRERERERGRFEREREVVSREREERESVLLR